MLCHQLTAVHHMVCLCAASAHIAAVWDFTIVASHLSTTTARHNWHKPACCRMAPSKDYIISSSQALVAIRPTTIASHAYHPLMQPPNMAQLLHAEGNDVCRWVRRQDRPTYLKEQLVVTAAPSASSSAATVDSYEGFAPAPEWSKSEVSQVEALRQQVEASSFCADGQLDSASQGVGASSSAGCNSNSSLQNNIVLADIGSNMDATSMFALSKLASASKLATVDILAGRMRQKHTTEATAETVAPHSTVAGSSVAMQPPDFASNSSLSRRSSKADSRPYSQGGGVRNSSRSIPKKTPVALKTDDWPVLSGRQHRAYHYAKGWHLPGMACKSKQLLEYQQKYGLPGRPILAAMTASTSAGNNDTVTSAMSVTQQAALAASQLLVPVEYLQVGVMICSTCEHRQLHDSCGQTQAEEQVGSMLCFCLHITQDSACIALPLTYHHFHPLLTG